MQPMAPPVPGDGEGPPPPVVETTLDSIVSGDGQGRRVFTRSIWMVIGLCIVGFVAMLLAPILRPIPVETLARPYPTIPADGTYLSMTKGPQVEQISIVFRVPEPKGPQSRIHEIAKLAGFAALYSGKTPPMTYTTTKVKGKIVRHAYPIYVSGHTKVSGNRKTGLTFTYRPSYPQQTETLTYDPAHGTYRYSVVMDDPSY